jgi:hypothetical protein
VKDAMISTAGLLSWLPDLLQWLPHLLGGGGVVAAAVAGFSQKLRAWALIGLAVLFAGAIVYGLVERGNYQAEKAGRAADQAAAKDKVIALQREAQAQSDMLIIHQAIAMGETASKATTHVQQIRSAPDDAGRMRAGSRGVHELILGGGGRAPAVGGAPAAVHGP